MSKFCMECGKPMEDNEEICPSCGSAQSNSAVGNSADGTAVAKKSSKKAVLGVVAAVVIVILLLIFKALFGGSYKEPIDNMFKAMETGKGKYLYKAMPTVIFDSEEFEDMKKSEIIEQFDDLLEYVTDGLEEAVGDDVKVSVKYLDKEKIDKDEVKEIEEEYEDESDLKLKVSKGLEVEVEVTIKGDDDKKTEEMKLEVYKVNGDWCILDVGSMF